MGRAFWRAQLFPKDSSGCCSFHGGITNACSYSGRIICEDRTESPSCFCSPPVFCPGGQYWNGSSCVCPSGSAWNGAACAYVPQIITATVVEYFNQALGHYFMTADSNEISVLDTGVLHGWVRTGQTFKAYLASDAPPLGISPVCRFYGRPEAGLDSHFYGASPAECNAVLQKFPQAWVLESLNVFYVYAPDSVTGACPGGTVPVYRLYNNRADVNHRYTISVDIKQQMISQGWIPEGYGPNAVGMCAVQ